MAEPVELTTDALFIQIGRLTMEVQVRAQREEAYIRRIQELMSQIEMYHATQHRPAKRVDTPYAVEPEEPVRRKR